MNVTGDYKVALETAQAARKAAEDAKKAAEEAKQIAEQQEADAAASATKESEEADNANAELNTANTRVSSAQAAYNNALSQLTQAQNGGDENAIVAAQRVVDSAYTELVNAQKEAEEARVNAEREVQEAQDAQKAAEEAKVALEKAESDLKAAEEALEKAITEEKAAEEALAAAEAEAAAAAKAAEEAAAAEEAQLTEEDAIAQGYTIIRTAEELQAMANNPGGKYILMGDIDLEGYDWTPVGDSENPFTGEFNGNGFAVKNLKIDASAQPEIQNVGFFGVTENATVKNVDFIDASVITPDDYVNGSAAVGIVAGTARGTNFDNITISGEVKGYESVGGLAGVINDNSYRDELGNVVEVGNSSISNVHASVNATGKYYVGGLVGYVKDTSTVEGVATRDLKITNCNTSGNIVFDDESAGGLIGEAGKTIITVNNCESSTNITWNNAEDDGDISFLMETGRAGGFIGCVNGSYIAICNSKYTGNLDADGDFKGEWYGWYMNDAHVTVYELSGGLPIDDILNIDGIDALTPVTDKQTGISHYEITVSTLTGLDKMVTMLQKNPALAEMITFNVNFDFEAMDGMYDPSIYSQYGVTQHLYEDADGNVHNDVYIDNEIDLETTFHKGEKIYCDIDCDPINCKQYKRTMVSGLYKDPDGKYVVSTSDGMKEVDMRFNSEGQITNVTKRLDSDEVKYREYITSMIDYYQQQMYAALREIYGLADDEEFPVINKAEYKKLQKKLEAGAELSQRDKLALAVYELDYKVMNLVADATHNQGCGMGGNASFLEETKAHQLYDKDGNARFTTLGGTELRAKLDADGNPMLDDEGNPLYVNLDGTDYVGLEPVFSVRGYPQVDAEGRFIFQDENGANVYRTENEDGTYSYANEDGTAFEGDPETLTQQFDEYSQADEYNALQEEMKSMLDEIKGS